MANQTLNVQDRLAIYATLATAIAVGTLGYFDHRNNRSMSTDPYARPDPWTGSDQDAYAKLIDATFERVFDEIREIKDRLDANDARWKEHSRWGDRISAGNDVEFEFIKRDLQKLQDQVFDLYTHRETND